MSVDHVGLSVADLNAMTDWYSRALPARVEYAVERPTVAMRGVVLIDGDGFRLELLHREHSRPVHGTETIDESLLRHGFGHLALRVDDVPAAVERLVALGAAAILAPRPGSQPGMTIAFVADPEHNLIEILSRSSEAPAT